MFHRNLHSQLDRVWPDTADQVESQQQQQKESHDQHATTRKFSINDQIYACNFCSSKAWVPGHILKASSPVSSLPDYQMAMSGNDIKTTYPEMSGYFSGDWKHLRGIITVTGLVHRGWHCDARWLRTCFCTALKSGFIRNLKHVFLITAYCPLLS